jgi:ADP-ribose pyrophosphatase YjhB (NUDIX family)
VSHAGWRLCPRCGAALALGVPAGEEEERLHCPACGLVLYDNPAPTASALVERDGRVMLTRRGIEPGRGLWDMAGGFVEPGEDPLETVRRELREETGLDVDVDDLVGCYPDVYGATGTATLNLFYRAHVVGGAEAAASSDVAAVGWFDPAELPLDGFAFACCARAARDYLHRFVKSL